MDDKDEWGPWIEHDGQSMPENGIYVHLVRANGDQSKTIVGRTRYRCKVTPSYPNTKPTWWHWESRSPQFGEIIRYRIRNPRGLVILEALLADLPAPVAPKVEA